MAKSRGKPYSLEKKNAVIEKVKDGKSSVAQIARDEGISASTIRRWLRNGNFSQDTNKTTNVAKLRNLQLFQWIETTASRSATALRNTQNRTLTGVVAVVSAVSIVAFISMLLNTNRSEKPYVAFIGRYSSPNYDRVNYSALRHFIRQGGFGGHELDVRSFALKPKDSSDLLSSTGFYKQLSDDPMCLAVVDNTWGSDIVESSRLISNSDLPVISINADKELADYKDRAVFMGHDDTVQMQIENFLRNQSDVDHLVFIGEQDYWSTENFENSLEGCLEPSITCQKFRVTTAEIDEYEWGQLRQQIASVIDEASTKKAPPVRIVFILNVHQYWGKKIIQEIEEQTKTHEKFATHRSKNPQENQADTHKSPPQISVIGGAYIFSSLEPGDFQGFNNSQLILITNPNDAVSPRVQSAIQELRADLGERPMAWRNAGHFVSRCEQAVEMMRILLGDVCKIKDETEFVNNARGRLISEFGELKNEVMVTTDKMLSFDKDLRLISPARLEVHSSEGVASYHEQLNSQGLLIPNIFIGLEVTSIHNVNVTDGTFFAEFSFSVRYDPKYKKLIGDPYKLIKISGERDKMVIKRIDSPNADDTTFYYRCSGIFSATFSAGEYPFDEQTLPIKIGMDPVFAEEKYGEAEYQGIGRGVSVSFDSTRFSGDPMRLPRGRVSGWETVDISVGVEEAIGYDGSPDKPSTLVQLTALIELRRATGWPIATVILPLIGMGFCGISLLFVENLKIENVGEMSVGLFIGFVGYLVAYRQLVPDTSDVSRADLVFYSTAIVILLQLFLIIVGNAVFFGEKMEESRQLSSVKIGRSLIAIGYFFAVCIFLMI